ncbi:NAD(P)-dependent alcohol dehydrogenase [Actinoplanes sp. NPDC051861]|uniref:NAD(P)-dependent alcohol dehydrogenase n=1 Tax=Actinoplanes sp. NPDC051861 TaxID=3155170 RepID=UPI00341982E5
MRALVQSGFGSPGQVVLREVVTPEPGVGEVLVRVHAVGLNAADRLMLRGFPYAIRVGAGGFRRPRPGFVAGRALAGRVVEKGEGVTEFDIGDDVFGEQAGALAEIVRVPAGLLARKPVELSFVEAAALPLGGTTALQTLRDAIRIQAGQRLLVTGAAGGIGTFAVQIAKSMGAHVTAECAGRNVDRLKAIGADEVRDYAAAGGPGEGYDAIFDLAGNHSIKELRGALNPGGVLALSVGTGGRLLGPARRILGASVTGLFSDRRLKTLVGRPNRTDLQEISEMSVRPVIDSVYSFEDAAEAMDRIDRGKIAGKVVVEVVPAG